MIFLLHLVACLAEILKSLSKHARGSVIKFLFNSSSYHLRFSCCYQILVKTLLFSVIKGLCNGFDMIRTSFTCLFF